MDSKNIDNRIASKKYIINSVRRKKNYGKPKSLIILRKIKYLRRWLLRNPWIRPITVFNYAAIKIQQIARGYITRKYGKEKRNKLKVLKSDKSKSNLKSNKKSKNQQLDKYLTFIELVQANEKRKPHWIDGGYSSWCAVKIQSVWRMFKVKIRVRNSKKLINQVAAIVIQTIWRNFRSEKIIYKRTVMLNPHLAAHIIQLKWRSFCNRRVYFYFRELVVVKLKGAPADLLKTIIPNESGFLDKAAGVHVRFRLGGSIFPPKIFFKIFTHKPICDVNSFAPRDYKNEKNIEAYQLNNKLDNLNFKSKKVDINNIRVGNKYFDTIVSTSYGAATDNNNNNWYRREERNPWRSISSQIFDHIETPIWFRDSPHIDKPKPFHYSRQKRQEEVIKEKKFRKRQWMMKAYRLAADDKNVIENNNNDMDYKSTGFYKEDFKTNNRSSVDFDADEKEPMVSAIDKIHNNTGYMFSKNATVLESKQYLRSDNKRLPTKVTENSLATDDLMDLVEWR